MLPSIAGTSGAVSAQEQLSAKEQLLVLLGIPSHLSGPADKNLPLAYTKYKAYLQATATLDKMIAAGTWSGKKPNNTEIIELFVSKSMWHSHYKPGFTGISQYPTMVQWLENDKNSPSDLETWGVEKSVYLFQDLLKYAANGGSLVEKEGKGKGKEKEKAKKVTKVHKKPEKKKDKKGGRSQKQ